MITAVFAVLLAAMRFVAASSPWVSVGHAITWFAILIVAGFLAVTFAGDRINAVLTTLREGIGRSFLSGLVLQMAILPGAAIVAILLAITIIGLLFIPFGLTAYVGLVLALAVFGFVAVAIMTGAAIAGGKPRDETPRGATLRAFFTGAAAYLALWLAGAFLGYVPLLGAIARAAVAGITFVGVTAGVGAVLLSLWRGKLRTSP